MGRFGVGTGSRADEDANLRAAGHDVIPQSSPVTHNTTVVHALGTRRDVLDPVIDLAEKNATNGADRTAVWNALKALAMATDKPPPLLGFADRSVKYLDGDGEPTFLTRDAFNKRWDRRMNKAAANRR